MNQLQIAKSFSLGQFTTILDCFSEHIIWEIVGQQRLVGVQEVTQHCQQIQHYFKMTEHHFQILKEVQTGNLCVIQGTAQLISPDAVTHISACDIYTFDSSNSLIQVESYCMTLPSTVSQ